MPVESVEVSPPPVVVVVSVPPPPPETSVSPIEVSVLPGIEEKVEFRLPAELLRAPPAAEPAS